MKAKTKAHLALLGANMFYGAGYTVAKSVMPRLVEPLAFILLRVGVVTALFFLIFPRPGKGRNRIARKDWPILILGGLFGVALNQMLFFLGLNQTLPIHASLIMMSTPLLITLFALVFHRQRLGASRYLGIALGIIGAALLMLAGKQITLTGNTALGDLLVFLNATSYALFLVIIKPLMERYRALVVIRWVFFFGLCFVFPFGWSSFMEIRWADFALPDFGALLFIVVFTTFFTYLWNAYALRHVSATVAGAYIYVQPLFASWIALVYFGEEITWIKAGAMVLLFVGVYLVNFGGRRKPAPPSGG